MPGNPIPETELALVEQAQNGDRNAFEELVRRHYPFVVRIVHRMCNDMLLAEDATQEAFLRAWLKLPSFRPESTFRNWLCRIAINAAIDVLRRKTEEPMEDTNLQGIATSTPDPEAAMIQKEQAAVLQKAVRSLPEGARSVLVLREYGEMSYQEIAHVLDIPIGTVMSRLNYARNKLKDLLRSQILMMEPEYAR